MHTINVTEFQNKIINWYHENGRKNLPWQVKNDPYQTWLSEIMLQQTQVNTVIPYFLRFINTYPRISDLAQAELDDVLHLWTGLGYYARARNLWRTAQIIHQQLQDQFPNNLADLMALPGIGRSTAGAILALAFNQQAAILDGNVKRVLTRLHGIESSINEKNTLQKLWQIAEQYTPTVASAEYTQAMMDIGATICTRSQPHCQNCPLLDNCIAFNDDKTNSIPKTKSSKKLLTKSSKMLILRNHQGEIYLQKRPPSGIWGGLWCLPELTSDTNVEHWCQTELGLHITQQQLLTEFRHTFSHFHLLIQPIQATVSKVNHTIHETQSSIWFSPINPPRIGLASPIKKLLAKLS
jgi:A/G-specific adenine glycosylase